MKSSITISRAIFAFGVLTVVGLVAVIFASNYALSQLKVGGPLYSKIKLGNDLIADILPPPDYVIEAYLEATLALQDPSTVAARRERLAQLKKDYDERHEFWMKSDLEPVNQDQACRQIAQACAALLEFGGTVVSACPGQGRHGAGDEIIQGYRGGLYGAPRCYRRHRQAGQ